MASPLSVFRKHQFVLMVGLVFVAMASFVILPSVDEYVRSQNRTAADLDEVIVRWSGGQLVQSDVDRMRLAHNLAVAYLRAVVQETVTRDGTPRGKGVSQNIFGQIVDPGIPSSDSDQNLVYTSLMASQAEDNGMVVTNDAVIEFLEQLSDGVIPRREFGRIFDETLGNRVTQDFLMDQLRTELLAQRMRQTMEAGLFIPPRGVVTPGEAWSLFQRLNRNVQAELVAVPVSNYFDQLSQPPSDAELEQNIYVEAKDRFPDPQQSEPGFMRRRKAAFQFARADFDKFHEAEKAGVLDEITDEEIEQHYEENKDRYVLKPEPDFPSSDSPADSPAEPPTSDEPADASATEKAPNPDNETTPQEEPEASEANADADSASTAPEGPKPESTGQPAPEDQSAAPANKTTFLVSALAQDSSQDGDDSAADSEPPSEDVDSPSTGVEEDAASTAAEDGQSTTEDTQADAEGGVGDGNSSEAEEPAEPEEEEVEYRPLDDELRQEIREELADIRARQPAQERLDAALEQVRRLIEGHGRKLRRRETRGEQEAEPVPPIALADIEKDELLEVGETPLVDSISVHDYELGGAYETQFISMPPRRIQFDEVAFQAGFPLYSPGQISGGSSGVTFLFWKTDNEEPYVPGFDEARDEVIAAWKKREALTLAKQAAEELVSQASATPEKSLTEVFVEREELKVAITDLFSWMSTGLNPASMGAPGISNVDGVEGVGPRFMEAVFALGEGEAGIAVNQPEDIVYVVRILLDSPTEDVLRQRFLTTGVSFDISSLATAQAAELQRDWYEDLEAKLGVEWVASEVPQVATNR